MALALGPIAFAALALIPSGLHHMPGLGSRPAYAVAVAAWMAVWWFTEALPIAWTAALPLVLFPTLGIFGHGLAGDARRTAAAYTDAYVFLFLGGLAIGAAMEEWGLHRRLALHVMSVIGTEPRRLLLGMLVATASVSAWISNTATAVMMLPIAVALVTQLEATRDGRQLHGYATALLLAVSYGANVGGIATKIGTPANSIFAGWLSENLGYQLGFLHYMAVGIPFAVLLLPLAWLVLWGVGAADARRCGVGGPEARAVVEAQLAALPPRGRAETIVGVCFVTAAVLWILGEPIRAVLAPRLAAISAALRPQAKHYEASVSVGAALVLLATGCLPWRALRRIRWDTLVLLGGSFALAAGIDGSGLSAWLGARLERVTQLSLFAQLAMTAAASIGLTGIASNTATVNVLLNLAPRVLPVLAVASIGSSCDFALPAGTPPNALVFGSGRVRLPTMMRVGLLLDLLAVALLTLYGRAWLPLMLKRPATGP